jgi:hypothetical protein
MVRRLCVRLSLWPRRRHDNIVAPESRGVCPKGFHEKLLGFLELVRLLIRIIERLNAEV